MPYLIRFKINASDPAGPTYNEIARAIAQQGQRGGEEPEFILWGNGSYPDSTVIKYRADGNFASALTVQRAIDAAGVRRFCTGGDLHLDPNNPIT